MLCPQKIHSCKQTFFVKLCQEGHYICTGICEKPTKYKKDNVWLCLSGKYCKDMRIEMTLDEALTISCAITTATAVLQEKEMEVSKQVAIKKKGKMVDLRKSKKGKKKSNGKKSKKR